MEKNGFIITPESGTGGGIIQVSCNKNTGNEKEEIINIKTSTITKTITLKQKGKIIKNLNIFIDCYYTISDDISQYSWVIEFKIHKSDGGINDFIIPLNDLLYISQSTGHESNDLIKQIEITNTSLLEEYFGYIEMNIYCADDAYKGQYNYYANCIIETDTGTSNITFNGGSDYKQEPQPFEGIYYNSGDENITINIESLDIMNN